MAGDDTQVSTNFEFTATNMVADVAKTISAQMQKMGQDAQASSNVITKAFRQATDAAKEHAGKAVEHSTVVTGAFEKMEEGVGSYIARFAEIAGVEEIVRRSFTTYAQADEALERLSFGLGATKAEIAGLSAEFDKLAASTGQSKTEIISQFATLVGQTGQSVEATKAMFNTIEQVAHVTGASVGDVGKAAAATANNLKVSTQDMNEVIATWANSVPRSMMGSFAMVMPRLTLSMQSLGISGKKAALEATEGFVQLSRAMGNPRAALSGLMDVMGKLTSSSSGIGAIMLPQFEAIKKAAGGNGGMLDYISKSFDLVQSQMKEMGNTAYGRDVVLKWFGLDLNDYNVMEAMTKHRAEAQDKINKLMKEGVAPTEALNRVMKEMGEGPTGAIDKLGASLEKAEEALGGLLVSIGASGAMNLLSGTFKELAKDAENIRSAVEWLRAHTGDTSHSTFDQRFGGASSPAVSSESQRRRREWETELGTAGTVAGGFLGYRFGGKTGATLGGSGLGAAGTWLGDYIADAQDKLINVDPKHEKETVQLKDFWMQEQLRNKAAGTVGSQDYQLHTPAPSSTHAPADVPLTKEQMENRSGGLFQRESYEGSGFDRSMLSNAMYTTGGSDEDNTSATRDNTVAVNRMTETISDRGRGGGLMHKAAFTPGAGDAPWSADPSVGDPSGNAAYGGAGPGGGGGGGAPGGGGGNTVSNPMGQAGAPYPGAETGGAAGAGVDTGGVAGGKINDENSFNSVFKGSQLEGHWNDVVAAAKTNGIDPSLMAAIMAQETGRGRNVSGNNPAGLMDPKNAMRTKQRFGSIAEGIDASGRVIAKNWRATGGDLGRMASRYAPVGANNDPNGLNAGWAAGVRHFYGGTPNSRTASLTPSTSGTPLDTDPNSPFSGVGGYNFMGSARAREMGMGDVAPGSPAAHETFQTGIPKGQGPQLIQANKYAGSDIAGFLKDLHDAGAPLTNFSGVYANRNIRGGHSASQHAYGNALDIETGFGTGPNNSPALFAWAQAHPKEFAEIQARHHMRNLGAENNDWGHFEWTPTGRAQHKNAVDTASAASGNTGGMHPDHKALLDSHNKMRHEMERPILTNIKYEMPARQNFRPRVQKQVARWSGDEVMAQARYGAPSDIGVA